MQQNPDHFILVCSTCEGADSVRQAINAAVQDLPPGFTLREVACMAGCARPLTVGFQAVDKAQYLFGEIQSVEDVEALTTFALQYHSSADGWTNATDRPSALYDKTLSRMPAINCEGQG